ncbi:LysR family transcriptional regulator [Cytobacillus sp. IB215316]|uniref:LysR family transcriptional regulator n=1 Tax=Cytobacillus sp. IB215316 TaxID=3097354 RepID=UPI002A0C3481|nr:LysR family transcriptional regulator [Cytobacillus sp. IB215316]MDX8360248.1 LysR family transcriptional regulator [Cytobacillus sp. IB215316]
MTLLQYEVFHTIVDTKSFTKAGEKLGLTQGAVSHAIKGLESELNLTLLYRNRSGITLTKEGEVIIDYIRQILAKTELMKQEAGRMNGLEIGTIRIGTFSSVSVQLLPLIIKKFHKLYPAIRVEFYEGGYEEIRKMILQGEVDIGFLPATEIDNLDFINLVDDHLYVIVPADHTFAKKKNISIHDIATNPFIMPKGGCDALVKRVFKENNVKPYIYCEIEDNPTISAMVEQNLGISIVPKMVLSVCIGEITSVRLKENYYRSIGLVANSFEHAPPVVQAFVELTKKCLEETE